MTFSIDLNGDAESRLKTAATRRGVKPEVYAKQIIEENLGANEAVGTDGATLELLTRWDAEDASTDPDEVAARSKEVDEFKQAMNENRLRSDGPASREIYP